MDADSLVGQEAEFWTRHVLAHLKPDRMETDLYLLISRHRMRYYYFAGEREKAVEQAAEAQGWAGMLYEQTKLGDILEYAEILSAIRAGLSPKEEETRESEYETDNPLEE